MIAKPTTMNGDPDEPRTDEPVCVDRPVREERAEHDRPPHGTRDGAEEYERHATGAALRREHLGGRSARELDDRACSAEHTEPHRHEHCGGRCTAGSDDAAADRADREAAADHRHAADTVHQPARRPDGHRARGEEDRGAETEDSRDPRHGDERQRAEGCGELEHARVADEPAGEQERVAPDGRCGRDAHPASICRRPTAKAPAPPYEGWRT